MAEDSFSTYYSDLLDATYDCVDRIVLNAYFPLGQSPGGFRTWWREVYGDDENLDNAHLMRWAGRFSRRLRGWAKKQGIPVIYTKRGDRKHELAQEYLSSDPDAEGICVILVSRAPFPVWDVRRSESGSFHLSKQKDPMPYVNHYSVHVLDREWGHVTLKICGHPPFGAQIILNGHEYVAHEARRRGIAFRKEGNCFTEVSDAAQLVQIAETLCSANAIGRLRRVCERWIYKCVCFALAYADQERSGFWYNFSVYQVEYSRNLLFLRGGEMERVFNGVIDRTRALLDIKTVKTLFGRKRRSRRRNGKEPRWEIVVERPEYSLTIFKIHFGRLTLKIYTKGEHVLRIEAVAHNTEDLRCGKVLDRFPTILGSLTQMLERFLEVLRCLDITWIQDTTLDDLPTSSQVGKTRVGGVDVNKLRIRAVIEAVVALACAPRGFTAREVAAKVSEIMKDGYRPRQAAYDLKKLRGKDLVTRIGKSHRYEPTSKGLRILAGLMTLRDKLIQPLLASTAPLKRTPKPKNRHELDPYYEAAERELRNLMGALNMAA